MARAAESLHHLCAQLLGLAESHQFKSAVTFNRDSMPRSDPRVTRFTQTDSNLLSVRHLRMNRKPQGAGKAIAQQAAPGVAALHHQERKVLTFVSHLGAALATF